MTPMHLLEQIFLKLPIESLVKLKAVCKDWKLLIKSRSFVHCYHKELLKTTDNRFVVLVSRFDIYTIGIDEIDGRFRYIGAKKICQNTYGFGLVGSCNGLLCFTNKWHKVSLYNPSTDIDRLVLPKMNTHKRKATNTQYGRVEHEVFGFGHDSSSYDYKVVRILWLCIENAAVITSQVEVYSLKSKSWKAVEKILFKPNIKRTTHGVFVNNAVHWLVAGYSPSSSPQIVSFDLGLEKFSLAAQPNRQTSEPDDMTLHHLNGYLALCIRPSGYFGINIWVMKEYGIEESWTRLFTIDALPGHIKPIALSHDESRVLLTSIACPSLTSNGKFWWYDVNERLTETEVVIANAQDGLKVEAFLGSKMLMNKDN